MALPKRIRDQLRADGLSVEDIAKEIQENTGDFGLNATPTEGVDDIPFSVDEDLPSMDDHRAPVPETPAPQAEASEEADPDDKDEDKKDEDKKDEPTTPVAETTEEPVTPAKYVNPFDVGLEDEEQPPAPAPAPTPVVPAPTQQEQPAPAPAPAPTTPTSPQFQLTADEVKALGGQKNADVLLGILARHQQPHQDEIRRDLFMQRLEAFRTNIVSTVPQYKEIVTSRSWQKFLDSYSPMSGGTIKEALIAADRRLDRKAVIGIFEDFRARHAPRDSTVRQDADKGGVRRPTPAELATPGKSATNNEGATSRRRYKFKESDAQKFDDLRRRKKMDAITYHDKVAEYEKALSEGKVELGV